MMQVLKHLLVIPALFVLGCASSLPERIAVDTPSLQGSVRVSMASLELRELSLPAYALADEVTVQDGAGALVRVGQQLWADKPDRVILLELTRHLSSVTSARIAPSPWPFEALPQAVLDLRFETLLARQSGSYDVTGQYFLGRLDQGRERSGAFDVSVAIAQPITPASVADARGKAIAQLADLLAREALR